MTQISTCGLQLRLTFLMNLRALMYSPWIIRAALTKSPSHLLTATRSATSTIPFFIPVQKCILVIVQWHNLKGLWELHVKQRAKQLVELSLLKIISNITFSTFLTIYYKNQFAKMGKIFLHTTAYKGSSLYTTLLRKGYVKLAIKFTVLSIYFFWSLHDHSKYWPYLGSIK